MKLKIKTLHNILLPNTTRRALKRKRVHSQDDTIYIDFFSTFRNAGYVRKIHSLHVSSNKVLHINKSTLYTKNERKRVPCNDKDVLLLSDYFTDRHFVFHNKFILIQCDFSLPSMYRILYTKEYPINSLSIPELESIIANEIHSKTNIKIYNTN